MSMYSGIVPESPVPGLKSIPRTIPASPTWEAREWSPAPGWRPSPRRQKQDRKEPKP